MTDLASAENKKVALRWRQQRQRALLDLPSYQTASANLIHSCCEVHGCIFSVITSGVICVLKLYTMLSVTFWWHALTVMHITCAHAYAHASAPCTFDQQRQRVLLDLPTRLLRLTWFARSCCEVHGCTFSVITSKSCYALLTFRWHALTVMHMHLTHAHMNCSTFDNCTRSGSPHNVLHSSSIRSVVHGVSDDYVISLMRVRK